MITIDGSDADWLAAPNALWDEGGSCLPVAVPGYGIGEQAFDYDHSDDSLNFIVYTEGPALPASTGLNYMDIMLSDLTGGGGLIDNHVDVDLVLHWDYVPGHVQLLQWNGAAFQDITGSLSLAQQASGADFAEFKVSYVDSLAPINDFQMWHWVAATGDGNGNGAFCPSYCIAEQPQPKLPEPGTTTLLCLGGLGLAGYIRRRRQAAA